MAKSKAKVKKVERKFKKDARTAKRKIGKGLKRLKKKL